MVKYLQPVRNWYARYERPISSLSLVGGFIFDALTLKRVDQVWENFWVLVHLLVVAVLIILINREENKGTNVHDPEKLHFWYINSLQFTFGGLLSVFLVFYFRSGSFFVAWPFLLILAAAFVANERLKKHFQRLTFQISLFYLSIFSFAIFIVPVLMHKIGSGVFIFSGIVSLIALWIFLRILSHIGGENLKPTRVLPWAIFGIYMGINVLYFTHVLPPIPLSLKDGGIYYNIVKQEDGNYFTRRESRPFFSLNLYETARIGQGDTLYAYSAVFSPKELNTVIIHQWQYRKPDSGEWVTVGTITLPLVGGREDGFRTYSTQVVSEEGKWRVNVKTSSGQVLGTIHFKVTFGAPENVEIQIKN